MVSLFIFLRDFMKSSFSFPPNLTLLPQRKMVSYKAVSLITRKSDRDLLLFTLSVLNPYMSNIQKGKVYN